MGLTIHYNGTFSSKASLPAMIEEVKDIAAAHHWPYHIYETHFPDHGFTSETFDGKVYGISFTPPESETVRLTFLSNGRLCNTLWLKYPDNDEAKNYLYMLFTKTQFAGWQIHQQIIHILRYISRKYFQRFTVDDEGMYWETENVNILQERFKQYTDLLNTFSTGLEMMPVNPGESLEDYFKRILNRKVGEL